MSYSNAYLIYRDDFKNRGFKDWLLSHISFAQPPHRYRGEVDLRSDILCFDVMDTQSNLRKRIEIQKSDIQELKMGYDSTFHVFQTRGLGLGWAPIRITLHSNPSNPLYLVVGFNGFISGNRKFLKSLNIWLNN
jgi:hypothetical protein